MIWLCKVWLYIVASPFFVRKTRKSTYKSKMNALLARVSSRAVRNVMASTVRNHGSHGGVPGENLPFDISNRYKLTLYFILFAGSGLSAPYLITRHQLNKK